MAAKIKDCFENVNTCLYLQNLSMNFIYGMQVDKHVCLKGGGGDN